MTKDGKPEITPDELWSAVIRDSDGLRQLRDYLDSIKTLDDAAFAETSGGVDRTETTALLDRLNHLLAELDQVTAQLHADAD